MGKKKRSTGRSRKLFPGGGGSELTATLTKGQIGDPELKDGEWEFLREVVSGKTDDIFDKEERKALANHYKDKLTIFRKAAVLLDGNPKLKEQYRGRVHDLASDLYEQSVRKSADKILDPILTDILDEAAKYVGGGGGGKPAL
jgi:hypothetical protein